jgi:hypothetical protein
VEHLNLEDDGDWTLDANRQFRGGVCQSTFSARERAAEHIRKSNRHRKHLVAATEPIPDETSRRLLHRFWDLSQWAYTHGRFCCLLNGLPVSIFRSGDPSPSCHPSTWDRTRLSASTRTMSRPSISAALSKRFTSRC